MRTLLFILEKEFTQIFRDPAILRIIFVMPMIQLILLPLAADYEVRNINLAVVDHDHSAYSQRLVQKLSSSGYFHLTTAPRSYDLAVGDLEADRADLILEIPADFERALIREETPTLLLAANAANGVKGSLGSAYAATILRGFNQEIRLELVSLPRFNPIPVVEVRAVNWYNPLLNYQQYMVPGILAILVTMVGAFLSALNIVREKEVGTIEQLNVTPIGKLEFILGKLIPFWVLGLVVLMVGMGVGWLVFGVWPVGSLGVLMVVSALYLLGLLGIGLIISTYADTQQQASLMGFFMIMIFVLLGGLYTPIESMPRWAQIATWFNPPAYYIEAIRMISMKGSNLADLRPQLWAMLGFAVVFNGWAVWNYRKRAA